MFQIFNGHTRGLGASPQLETYLKMGVNFRQHLHCFKGCNLAVFLCIVLHANDKGWSNPTLAQIKRETGYETATISATLTKLCSTKIDGCNLLFAMQERTKGKFKNNTYLIFPTKDEIAKYGEVARKPRGAKSPYTEKPYTVKPNTENPIDGINQSLEEPLLEDKTEDNPSSNDSVAAATGVEASSEVTALPYDPNKPEADPTPSPDETPDPPSSGQPSQAGVPDGYVMRYAGGSGRTAHLVHVDTTETACGKPTETLLDAPKPDRSYGMCPQCMAKLRPIVRKPSIDQPVKDAIAEHLQVIPINMATSHTGVLANIAINVWKRWLGRALTNAEYEKVARSVAAFVPDYRKEYPDRKLPTTLTGFEEYFTKFVAAIKSNAAPTNAGAEKGADHGSTAQTEPTSASRHAKNSTSFKAPRRD